MRDMTMAQYAAARKAETLRRLQVMFPDHQVKLADDHIKPDGRHSTMISSRCPDCLTVSVKRADDVLSERRPICSPCAYLQRSETIRRETVARVAEHLVEWQIRAGEPHRVPGTGVLEATVSGVCPFCERTFENKVASPIALRGKLPCRCRWSRHGFDRKGTGVIYVMGGGLRFGSVLKYGISGSGRKSDLRCRGLSMVYGARLWVSGDHPGDVIADAERSTKLRLAELEIRPAVPRSVRGWSETVNGDEMDVYELVELITSFLPVAASSC